MGALSYADDIIFSCPSIRGLNRIIKICSFFANSNHITFNGKKTVCIKFGGNHLDISCNDERDCQIKTLHFIGYVNKLIVNFSHLCDYMC